MVKKIIATVFCAFMLMAVPGETKVLRPQLEPVSSKPEIVRDAGVCETENFWQEFTEYISLGEAENDRAGDTGGTESAGTDGDLPGCDREVYPDDSVSAEGDNEGTEGAEQLTEDSEPEPEKALTYAGDWTVTFYCQCEQCCGRWAWSNSTASGAVPQAGWTVAAGESFPFGTILYIEGFGYYEVQDRGVPDGWVDIYVNSHSEIPGYGMTVASVYIVG